MSCSFSLDGDCRGPIFVADKIFSAPAAPIPSKVVSRNCRTDRASLSTNSSVKVSSVTFCAELAPPISQSHLDHKRVSTIDGRRPRRGTVELRQRAASREGGVAGSLMKMSRSHRSCRSRGGFPTAAAVLFSNRKTTPASRSTEASRYLFNRSATPPSLEAARCRACAPRQ